jgi:dephospho-CoA kinase
MNKIIGITGVAGSGKDLFYSLLSKKRHASRFALAYELKNELRDFSMSLYGIDPVSCSRADKEKIRNLLVFHGDFRRKQTEGRYWIEKLEQKINFANSEVICITDIRFVEYEKDEIHWLKKEKNGILIHISRILEDGTIKLAPNEKEEKNDPILKDMADYRIKWSTSKNISELDFHVENFVKWLDKI